MLTFRTVNIVTLVLLLALFCLHYFFKIPWWVYPLIVLIWLSITIMGSFAIGWNYHLPSLNFRKGIKENYIAITFDDGPDPNYTPKVLDLLEKYNATATFFCIGHRAESHPKLLNRIVSEYHTIGNHTYSHATQFGFFGTNRVQYELNKTIDLVKEITGKSMKLYRPAYGVTNPSIRNAVIALGLKTIGWNIRSFDTTALSQKSIFRRITTNITKGDIILLHDTSAKSVAVLEQLLIFLQKNNLQSVTVDTLLEIEAYA